MFFGSKSSPLPNYLRFPIPWGLWPPTSVLLFFFLVFEEWWGFFMEWSPEDLLFWQSSALHRRMQVLLRGKSWRRWNKETMIAMPPILMIGTSFILRRLMALPFFVWLTKPPEVSLFYDFISWFFFLLLSSKFQSSEDFRHGS